MSMMLWSLVLAMVEQLLQVGWREGDNLSVCLNWERNDGVGVSPLATGSVLTRLAAGEYPETVKEAGRELHLSGDFSTKDAGPVPIETGDPTSLYHLILGNGQNAFVANGSYY